jgi:P-type Mg2+ transporter
MNSKLSAFWSLPANRAMDQKKSTTAGLSNTEALLRLKQYGINSLTKTHKSSQIGLLLNQFKSPIVLILIFAAKQYTRSMAHILALCTWEG